MIKNLPRLICFVSALAGFAAFSGCSSQTTRLLPTGEKIIRSAEELRVARQPLTWPQASAPGYADLELTGTDGKSLSLFLNRDEVALLKAADHRQAFEIRYWYYEETHGDSAPIGTAEVESIRDGQTLIIDHTRCRLHNQVMTRRLVRISYGLPMREYLEALYRDFPNAAVQMGGCVVSPDSPKETPAYVCPVCDAAYQAWKPTPQKEPTP
jgi:hypothetical protein